MCVWGGMPLSRTGIPQHRTLAHVESRPEQVLCVDAEKEVHVALGMATFGNQRRPRVDWFGAAGLAAGDVCAGDVLHDVGLRGFGASSNWAAGRRRRRRKAAEGVCEPRDRHLCAEDLWDSDDYLYQILPDYVPG